MANGGRKVDEKYAHAISVVYRKVLRLKRMTAVKRQKVNTIEHYVHHLEKRREELLDARRAE